MTRRPRDPAFLDIFERRLRLEGTLATCTGLHIGAGGGGDPIGTDLPVIRDGLGRPMIPGASLKGVLRSAAEALFRHFPRPRDNDPKPLLWTCDVVGKDPCVSHDLLTELRDSLPADPKPADLRAMAELVWGETCTVCRLFGSVAMASRVRFPDLLLADEALPKLEVRNGVGIERDKQIAARGVLYDFEAVPPGTHFDLTMIADNFDDFEIGLLLYLFDELHRGALSLGGKSSRGLGHAAITWRTIEEVELDPSRGTASNPFANLLRRCRHQDTLKEAPKPALDLPIPSTGDPELWTTLAEHLDTLDEPISKETIGRFAIEIGLKKSDAGKRLGIETTPRQAWANTVKTLIACDRLVEADGVVIPKLRVIEAQARAEDRAEFDTWLIPLYERFVGAMDEQWQEAAA